METAKKKLKMSDLNYLKSITESSSGQLMSTDTKSSKQSLLTSNHYHYRDTGEEHVLDPIIDSLFNATMFETTNVTDKFDITFITHMTYS